MHADTTRVQGLLTEVQSSRRRAAAAAQIVLPRWLCAELAATACPHLQARDGLLSAPQLLLQLCLVTLQALDAVQEGLNPSLQLQRWQHTQRKRPSTAC